MPDPTQGVTDLVQHAKDDVDKLAHFLTDAASSTAHEGISLTSEAAQVALDLVESVRATLASAVKRSTGGSK